MSRVIFWNENNDGIQKEIVFDKEECRQKCNGVCYNLYSKKLGKKCHGCEKFIKENNKVEPYFE